MSTLTPRTRDGLNGTIGAPTSRRGFIATLGAAALLGSSRPAIGASGVSRVVVVGGGFAGATAAKYLKLWGGDAVEVVLVDRWASHTSCVMSNLVLNDRLRLSGLRFSYDTLAQRYGVVVVRARVVGIRPGVPGQIVLGDGTAFGYDRLVVAPGVAFDPVEGWNPRTVPHAWIAGGQTNRLRDQIRAMPDSGTFVMTIPKAPYRCPPGPYERACIVADILGRRSGVLGGGGSPSSAPKVVVLDANDGIQAEAETFHRAFTTLYRDIVEYHPGVTLEAVDSGNRVAVTDAGDFDGDVLNVIPRHRAPGLLRRAGLTAGARWAPVDPLSYESIEAESIHVIGDSQGTDQPKSGHMANAQAKVCADAVLRMLAGAPIDDEERVANITTNSACYSPITYDEASWLTAGYSYDRDTGTMTLTPDSLGEAGRWNRGNFEEMLNWSENLFADTFG